MWEYNYISNDNDYLAHYGVLGMKWGVRRGRVRSARYKAGKKTEKLKKKFDKANTKYEKLAGRYYTLAGKGYRTEHGMRRVAKAKSKYLTAKGNATKKKYKLDQWERKVEKNLGDEALRSYKAKQNSKALYNRSRASGADRKTARAEVSAAKKNNSQKYATTKDKQKAAKQRELSAIQRERQRTKRKKKR